jgi:hypothetical protein
MRARILLLATVCLSVLTIHCKGRSFSSPSETVQTFYRLLDARDVDGGVRLLSKNQMNGSGGPNFARGLLVISIEVLGQNGGIKSIEILSETVVGDSAQVDAKILLNNGNSVLNGRNPVRLIKENDEWKIDDY